MNMMLNPRWKKALRDLGLYKFRTFLVIISIAMSIAGIGMIGQGSYIITIGMNHSFEKVKPSSGAIYSDPFTGDVLEKIKKIKGIDQVQAKTILTAKTQPAKPNTGPEFKKWKRMNLFSMDYKNQRMDLVFSKDGRWPTRKGELFLEETTLKSFHFHVGEKVWIETPNGIRKKMKIAGVLNAPGMESTLLSKTGYGFIHPSSLEMLGYPDQWNTLTFKTTGSKYSSQFSQQIADKIKKLLLQQEVHVNLTHVPGKMQHWAYDIVQSMTIVLNQLGFLVFLAATGIVVNTVNSILNNQVKQIGIMQAIGARPRQLFTMYIVNVFIYSLCALMIGIPLGMMGARRITQYSTNILGFDTSSISFSQNIVLLQILVGVMIPMLASVIPILKGSRITVREAINGVQKQSSLFLRNKIGISRRWTASFLLSFRNTFRKKARLCISLISLTLSGIVILSVFSIHTSMEQTNANALKYTKYDLQLTLSKPEDAKKISAIKNNPNVSRIETWNQIYGNRVRDNGSISRDMRIIVPKIHSPFIQPDVVKGRWFKPADKNVIVLDTYLLRYEKDIQIGDRMTMNVNGIDKKLKVIGFVRKVNGEVMSYADPHFLDGLPIKPNEANLVNIAAKNHSRESVTALLQQITKEFKKDKLAAASSQLTLDVNEKQEARSNVLLVFLMAMGVLILAVSTIGLMGNTSLNIMERNREVGVLRSIGASNLWIFRIITMESILTCLIAWGLAVLISFPVSRALSNEIGDALFKAPLDYAYSYSGIWVWFLASMAVGAAASFIPVWNCIRMTVRDVLSFE